MSNERGLEAFTIAVYCKYDKLIIAPNATKHFLLGDKKGPDTHRILFRDFIALNRSISFVPIAIS